MDWRRLKDEIYYWDGSWRDIYVQNTTAKDWEKWVALVNERYRIHWHNPATDKSETKIDFEVIKAFWNGDQDLCSTAHVFLKDLQINAHFFEEAAIENDIDPREFKTIDDHNSLMNYLKLVANIYNKPIIVTPENCPDLVLLKIFNDKIEIYGNQS